MLILRVLKLIFVKPFIQRICLNHLTCVNLDDLKEDFLTQNNLGMPHSFRLKNGQNAETSHTHHILPRRFQGTF